MNALHCAFAGKRRKLRIRFFILPFPDAGQACVRGMRGTAGNGAASVGADAHTPPFQHYVNHLT